MRRCFGHRGRNHIDLVFGHVVVHIPPPVEYVGFGSFGIERETILQRPAGVTAGAADGFAFGLCPGGFFDRIGDAKLLATREGSEERQGEDGGLDCHGKYQIGSDDERYRRPGKNLERRRRAKVWIK